MKKIYFIIILSFIIGVFDVNAQHKFTSGLQLNYVSYKVIGIDNTSIHDNLPFWEKVNNSKAGGLNINGTIGYNPTFYKFNDKLTLGASINIGIGYILTPKLDGLNGSVVFDFPEYLTIRYGQKGDINYGVGVGYDYTYNTLPFQEPSIMAEISLSKFTFRVNANLLKYTYYYYYTSEGPKPAIYVWPIGLQVLVKF